MLDIILLIVFGPLAVVLVCYFLYGIHNTLRGAFAKRQYKESK